MEAVRPLHQRMGPAQEGGWLDVYGELGQSFEEYRHSQPHLARGERRVIYVLPVGRFTPAQERIVGLAAAYMRRFFNLEVTVKPPIPLGAVPPEYRRGPQIHTAHFLQNTKPPHLPADAAALIAFTAVDLYPGDDMNFVFGEATLRERVGVWSLHRFGRPDASKAEFRLTLLRTLKLATRETGHIFGMLHCAKYECNMSGTNSLEETDRRRADVFPECMAKIAWANGYAPRLRYQRLKEFCRENGLSGEAEFYAAEEVAIKDEGD
jgi:archaemetzincin